LRPKISSFYDLSCLSDLKTAAVGNCEIVFSQNWLEICDRLANCQVARADYINAIAIQGDDKIVATGFATVDGSYDLVVARYDAQGNLDTDFSAGGIALTHFSGMDFGNGIAIQADRKIVAVGQVGGDFSVVRHDALFDIYLPLIVRSYP
jgi:hypothetical protein